MEKGLLEARKESEQFSPSRKVLGNRNSIFTKTKSFIEQKK